MKRHTAEGGEGISSLPAAILHRVLYFLSQAEALRTCVLSKSWRHLGSTRPKFSLKERYFGEDKEKFACVLDKSLQVYYDQKLSIELFRLRMSMADPELASLLENWIPKVIHDMGVNKFDLRFVSAKPEDFDLPSAVFESESLQELYLQRCNLSKINCIGKNHHLKALELQLVYIKEETFAKIMSSCSLIERLSLYDCKGIKTINMHNHHNLKSFELSNRDASIEIYLPSTVRCISIYQNPNWFHHRNYFPGLTCLRLAKVPLSNEWFNSFSRNFPCLEELRLWNCNGFVEFQLSSRSIKKLCIRMDKSTVKATIDAPSIKLFQYKANISKSISFSTTSSKWKSQIRLSLDTNVSLWFPKICELVAAFSQSQISLMLSHHSGSGYQHIEHLSDKMPVAIGTLKLDLGDLFSDLVNGLFRVFRPRKIQVYWYVNAQKHHQRKKNEATEFLCRTLQSRRSSEDEGMSFWQHDLEEVSLDVKNGYGSEEWHPVQGTINWSEYVAALLPSKYSFYELRFPLKWRE